MPLDNVNLGVPSLEMVARPNCDSGMGGWSGERRAVGIKRPGWWWTTRIHIIVRQITSRFWAREEDREPGARVLNARGVGWMSADVNNEKSIHMVACASERQVTRWELYWEQQECQFLFLNMKFMGWWENNQHWKTGVFRDKPEFSEDMERTCGTLQVLSGSSRGWHERFTNRGND